MKVGYLKVNKLSLQGDLKKSVLYSDKKIIRTALILLILNQLQEVSIKVTKQLIFLLKASEEVSNMIKDNQLLHFPFISTLFNMNKMKILQE
jgi:hypothetical protein